MMPLKYLSNFWGTFEMKLINCDINLILAWFENCFVINNYVANQNPIFSLTDTKCYVPVVTLPTKNNAKLLQQLKSGFKKKLTRINIDQK